MKKILFFTILVLLGIARVAAQEKEYVPLVREGVKWINEKVIINNGDTTSYYYKYEFSGKDTIKTNGIDHNACYYYTGDQLDVQKDSLIAGLRNEYKYVYSFRNHAYYKLFLDDRLVFPLIVTTDGGTRLMYDFYSSSSTLYYYLYCQDFWVSLNVCDSYMKAEYIKDLNPIEIDGVECMRSAYLDDNGDTLCYVVEGIGFDSYDMGDLLTPFTRRPDPNADYQEYCGLSHVIKDGQIIYKGMRYREGAYEGIDDVVTEQPRRVMDGNYYNLMGQPVGKVVPSTPGIYIHNGSKICVSRMP